MPLCFLEVLSWSSRYCDTGGRELANTIKWIWSGSVALTLSSNQVSVNGRDKCLNDATNGNDGALKLKPAPLKLKPALLHLMPTPQNLKIRREGLKGRFRVKAWRTRERQGPAIKR